MALGSIPTLAEMSTRNISWGKRRPVRKANNLTTILPTSWNPLGPSGPVTGLIYLLFYSRYKIMERYIQ